jgi:hypothetical protein
MPINFKSFTNYLFSTSAKTETQNLAQADKGRSSFSFSALRNSRWAKKCAEFDAVALARTIRNNPRTKKAIESARKGLGSLFLQMSTHIKNMRSRQTGGGFYGTYQAPIEELQINGQWSAFLPQGAIIQPGSFFDPECRMQRISWQKDGVIWTAAHNLKTGEHTSSTGWSMVDKDGWQHSQMIDHRSGIHWSAFRNQSTGQHMSQTPWRVQDAQGWQSCNLFDHKTEMSWTAFHHPGTSQSYSRTEWSKPGEDGIQSRTTIDHHTRTRWHETFNAMNGAHMSKSDWYEDVWGMLQRVVKNHQTGETYIEPGKHTEPSSTYESSDFSFDMNGKSAQELAVESLGILELDKSEENKETIKGQYKKLAWKYHPDKIDKNDKAAVDLATEAFAKLSNAYKFLSSDKFPVKKEEG